MGNAGVTRRSFLAGSAATVGALATGFGAAAGEEPSPSVPKSPNEKLNIAGIGVGGQGGRDIDNFSILGENIVALCDVDDAHAADTYKRYPDAKKYRNFREMLEKEKSIDAVVIGTPDHLHAVVAMAAIQMGKHVYCEKPLTHSIYEARALAKAARDAKVATQMGNQGHANEGVRLLQEWFEAGLLGEVREVCSWTNRPTWAPGLDAPDHGKLMPVVPA
ncbi:MAG: Gfo/Idh/MocA family oxidoreductase, partial [Candidatus Hydrogenedentales bacterium]